MLTRFFSRTVRRSAYGFMEALTVVVFGFSFSVAFLEHRYMIGSADPGMAKATAACLMALSAAVFTLTICVKRNDANS